VYNKKGKYLYEYYHDSKEIGSFVLPADSGNSIGILVVPLTNDFEVNFVV